MANPGATTVPLTDFMNAIYALNQQHAQQRADELDSWVQKLQNLYDRHLDDVLRFKRIQTELEAVNASYLTRIDRYNLRGGLETSLDFWSRDSKTPKSPKTNSSENHQRPSATSLVIKLSKHKKFDEILLDCMAVMPILSDLPAVKKAAADSYAYLSRHAHGNTSRLDIAVGQMAPAEALALTTLFCLLSALDSLPVKVFVTFEEKQYLRADIPQFKVDDWCLIRIDHCNHWTGDGQAKGLQRPCRSRLHRIFKFGSRPTNASAGAGDTVSLPPSAATAISAVGSVASLVYTNCENDAVTKVESESGIPVVQALEGWSSSLSGVNGL
ncbi:hypothetical protein IAT38_001460 [Cryptococcus sp. DSM 104549]